MKWRFLLCYFLLYVFNPRDSINTFFPTILTKDEHNMHIKCINNAKKLIMNTK